MKKDNEGKTTIDRAIEYESAKEALINKVYEVFSKDLQGTFDECGIDDIQIVLRSAGEEVYNFSFAKKSNSEPQSNGAIATEE